MERRFFPVVHVDGPSQALRNVQVAQEAGAHGVFLIVHGGDGVALLEAVYDQVRQRFPGLWVGLNYLDCTLTEAHERAVRLPGVRALWADDVLLDGNSGPLAEVVRLEGWRKEHCPELEFFGSVAFKGQGFTGDPGVAARMVAPFVDVITTSGPATGKPAPVEKVALMKGECLNKSLALASGVTAENLNDYLPYVDTYLVSTGIGRTFTEFEPRKVVELAKLIRE
jgi:uncharacterized protein